MLLLAHQENNSSEYFLQLRKNTDYFSPRSQQGPGLWQGMVL